jgi:hypothetical protein
MHVREQEIRRKRSTYPGTVMFPTTHDITPEVLSPCLSVLVRLLEAGNSVLVVSKPHVECIETVCKTCDAYKDALQFRFTIGADDDEILAYWEPGAPKYHERIQALRLAFEQGFRTSVSVEPMLDGGNIVRHVTNLSPYVSDSIWIGKLNNIHSRVPAKTDADRAAIQRIVSSQTDERICDIYDSLRNHPLVRWKESIKKVVGLTISTEPGRDQ